MAKDSKTSNTSVAKPGKAERAAVGRVNEVLRGPVVDVFLQHIPAFRGLGRDQAFELVMSNPQLVEECFKLFRKKPDLFEKLIVGPDGAPITDEHQELACGRSLAEVVALVVRAAAKRHFQTRLGGPREEAPPPLVPARAETTGWRRMLARLLPPQPSTPPQPPPKRKATRADRLYREMHASLLYEWQLPLIKHYAPLPVSTVRQLGPRILEFREPTALKVLLTDGPPPAPEPTKPPATAGRAAAAGGSKLPAAPRPAAGPPQARAAPLPGAAPGGASPGNRAETMWKIGQSLQLHKLFVIEEAELRRTIALASGVGGHVFTGFSSIGLKLRETVVVLCSIDRQLGHAKMTSLLASDAEPAFLNDLIRLLRQEGVAALSEPSEIRDSLRSILAQLKKLGRY